MTVITTKRVIKSWLDDAVVSGATHMLVVTDQFDHTDYPVVVLPKEEVQQRIDAYNAKSMQNVIEVYDLRKDLDSQLNSYRAWNL